MKTLILATASDWAGVGRLPEALSRAGFVVRAICPTTSYLAASSYVEGAYLTEDHPTLRQFAINLKGAFENWAPELIIPGDDAAAQSLHLLCQAKERVDLGPVAYEVLARSLGDLGRLEERERKSFLGQVAGRKGFVMPPQVASPTLEAAREFVRKNGLPVIVKADYTAAGQGVRVCRNTTELEEFLRNPTGKNSDVLGRPFSFTLQKFVTGPVAGVALSALTGQTLAAFAYVKERTFPEGTGPASVIRIVERPELIAAAGQVVRYLGYTGLCGVDFVIEHDTQKVYLIEFNGRPTPACNLGAVAGVDLLGSFFSALTGKAGPAVSLDSEPQRLIALFPNEWLRDKDSVFLREAYHDVPWNDPRLLRRLINAGTS
jgi:hypothetical protein